MERRRDCVSDAMREARRVLMAPDSPRVLGPLLVFAVVLWKELQLIPREAVENRLFCYAVKEGGIGVGLSQGSITYRILRTYR